MLVRGAFNHILRPGLRKDFRDSYRAFPEEFSKFLNSGSQDRAEVEVVDVAGLPRMIKRGEGEPTTYIDPVQGDKVTFVDDEYSLGFMVGKKLMEDDLYGQASKNAQWLGRSARMAQEFLAAGLLDDAFAGATFTGRNSEVLCETTHQLLNSAATSSNRLANDTQLGVTGLQAAYDLASTAVDNNGDPIIIMPSMIIVDPANEWVASQLAKSQLEPFTADNQVNALRSERSFTHMVSHYKTAGDAWFIVDKSLSDAHFLFRVRPEFTDGFDFDTDTAKFKGRQRINTYFFDWRGWIGSLPS